MKGEGNYGESNREEKQVEREDNMGEKAKGKLGRNGGQEESKKRGRIKLENEEAKLEIGKKPRKEKERNVRNSEERVGNREEKKGETMNKKKRITPKQKMKRIQMKK